MSSLSHTPARPARVAVAVSGGGRSLENFLAKRSEKDVFTIAAVIASRPDCRGATIAKDNQIPLYIGDFVTEPESNAQDLCAWLKSHQIDWIVLAGFLKRFPLMSPWRLRTINIHPALLPDFGGKGMYGDRVHAAVLAAGRTESGATVHYVNDRYDEGAVIAQIIVPVLPQDDAHALAARVFAAECELYPRVLKHLIEGTLPKRDGAPERYRYDQF